MKKLLLAFAIAVMPGTASALGLCSVTTATSMDFGDYDVFSSTPDDSTSTVTIGCLSLLSSQSIFIQLSKGSSSTFTPRTMKFGAYALQYNIYLDTQRTVIFGDGTGGTSVQGPVLPERPRPGLLHDDPLRTHLCPPKRTGRHFY